jgi:hypothetical protein
VLIVESSNSAPNFILRKFNIRFSWVENNRNIYGFRSRLTTFHPKRNIRPKWGRGSKNYRYAVTIAKLNHAENGVRLGRKTTLSDGQLEEMRQKRLDGVKIKDLMDEYGLSKASIYRLLGDSWAEIGRLKFSANRHGT